MRSATICRRTSRDKLDNEPDDSTTSNNNQMPSNVPPPLRLRHRSFSVLFVFIACLVAAVVILLGYQYYALIGTLSISSSIISSKFLGFRSNSLENDSILGNQDPQQAKTHSSLSQHIFNTNYEIISNFKKVDDDQRLYSEEELRSISGPGFNYEPARWVSKEKSDYFTPLVVKDEPIDTIFNRNFSELISFSNDDNSDCLEVAKAQTEEAMELFKYWLSLAAVEKIPYVLLFGSLVGYARNKEITPYDHDIDVGVPPWSYNRLMKYASPLPPQFDQSKFILLLREEGMLSGRKKNCASEKWAHWQDLCNFKELLGIIHYKKVYIDIYSLTSKSNKLITELHANIQFHRNEIFPLRPCTFVGFTTYCPNQMYKLIFDLYAPPTKKIENRISSLLPNQMCRSNHQFQPKNDSESIEITKLWKEKYHNQINSFTNHLPEPFIFLNDEAESSEK